MLIFLRDAGRALYNVFVGFEPASTTRPVDSTVLALAGLDVWTTSVIDLLREKKCCRGRRANVNSDISENFLCSVTTQIMEAVLQLASCWPSEESEVNIKRNSVDLRRKFILDMARSAAPLAFFFSLYSFSGFRRSPIQDIFLQNF